MRDDSTCVTRKGWQSRRPLSTRLCDPVEFYGEYEWNEKGDVIHWNYHDSDNRHAHG